MLEIGDNKNNPKSQNQIVPLVNTIGLPKLKVEQPQTESKVNFYFDLIKYC